MKQLSFIVFFAVVIAGCSDNVTTAGRESTTTVQEESSNELPSNTIQSGINEVDVDTIGMAEFLAMKAANAAQDRSSNASQVNDISNISDVNVDTIGFAEFKRMKVETARVAYEDSIKRAEIIADRKRANASREANAREAETAAKNRRATRNSQTDDQSAVVSETPAAEKEKKGWSKKAKGAVIGAATGAAAGAVINKKNRGVGGVIGGVVGAAAGYGVGRQKDKKDTTRKVEERRLDEEQQQ